MDEDFAATLRAAFVAEASERLERVDRALAAGATVTAQAELRALRDSSAAAGFEEVAASCQAGLADGADVRSAAAAVRRAIEPVG